MNTVVEWAQVGMLLFIFFALSDLAYPLRRIAAELKRYNDRNKGDA